MYPEVSRSLFVEAVAARLVGSLKFIYNICKDAEVVCLLAKYTYIVHMGPQNEAATRFIRIPTDFSQPKNTPVDFSELHRIRRLTDFEAR